MWRREIQSARTVDGMVETVAIAWEGRIDMEDSKIMNKFRVLGNIKQVSKYKPIYEANSCMIWGTPSASYALAFV